MTKIKRPTGLIRYASKNEVESGVRKIFTPKAIGYTVVLFILSLIIGFMLINRSDYELSMVRTPGLMAQEQPGDKLSNLYDVSIINKTFDSTVVTLEVYNMDDMKGEVKIAAGDLTLKPQGVSEAKIFVIFPKEKIKKINTPIEVAVKANGEIIDVIKTSFLGKLKGRKFGSEN